MTPKKILLAYINKDSGHHRASLAIEKALKNKFRREAEISNIDFMQYFFPVFGKILDKAYMRTLEKNPQQWGDLYDNPKVYAQLNKWVDKLTALKYFKLTKLIKKFDPDIICCTQAFPALMLANFKKLHSLKASIVGVLTDYSPHRYWVHPNIDLYIVPSKETGEALIVKGAKSDRVKDLGIPIDQKFFFTNRVNKEKVFRQLHLVESLPVVLVMGGGQGFGPIKAVIKGFNKFSPSFQLVVVCGRNQKLREEIEKESSFLHYPIKILGYAENIDELMKISSLVITKPGGLTVSECLACGLPMIITNPIPGQEALNAQFLLEHRLAISAANGEEAAQAAVKLLEDDEARNRIHVQSELLAKPDAASAIADVLMKG